MSAETRGFITDLVAARTQALQKGVSETGPDVLQCLLEHSDPSWSSSKIVEYVS